MPKRENTGNRRQNIKGRGQPVRRSLGEAGKAVNRNIRNRDDWDFQAKEGQYPQCFLQNKANLRKCQMNISVFITKDYENKPAFGVPKNKAKQSQFHDRSQNTDDRKQKTEDERQKPEACSIQQAQGRLRVCSWCVLYRVIGNRYDTGSV